MVHRWKTITADKDLEWEGEDDLMRDLDNKCNIIETDQEVWQ